MTVGSRVGVAVGALRSDPPGVCALLTLGPEPAGGTVLGSAMRAGSNEPDGVLRYQVGPASRPSPGSASSPLSTFPPPPPSWTPGPLPEGEGRPSRDSRGRSRRLGAGGGCERVTLAESGSWRVTAASRVRRRGPLASRGAPCRPGLAAPRRNVGE